MWNVVHQAQMYLHIWICVHLWYILVPALNRLLQYILLTLHFVIIFNKGRDKYHSKEQLGQLEELRGTDPAAYC